MATGSRDGSVLHSGSGLAATGQLSDAVTPAQTPPPPLLSTGTPIVGPLPSCPWDLAPGHHKRWPSRSRHNTPRMREGGRWASTLSSVRPWFWSKPGAWAEPRVPSWTSGASLPRGYIIPCWRPSHHPRGSHRERHPHPAQRLLSPDRVSKDPEPHPAPSTRLSAFLGASQGWRATARPQPTRTTPWEHWQLPTLHGPGGELVHPCPQHENRLEAGSCGTLCSRLGKRTSPRRAQWTPQRPRTAGTGQARWARGEGRDRDAALPQEMAHLGGLLPWRRAAAWRGRELQLLSETYSPYFLFTLWKEGIMKF